MKSLHELTDWWNLKLRKSYFLKSVARMAGGAFLAQLIGILVLPLLTRLYSPDDFGVLAIYAAAVSIVISIAGLRFEIAIPLPENERDAVGLFILALGSCVLITLITAIAILIFENSIVEAIGQQRLRGMLWLLPVGVLIGGAYNALLYWGTREGSFKAIARTKIFQATAAASFQLAMGFHGAPLMGLLIGYVVSIGSGGIGLVAAASRKIKEQWKIIRYQDIKVTFEKYQSFPKFSSLEALSNTAGTQLPIILIAAYLSSVEAGFLMLALRCMQAPMTLIGSSIAQVYLSEAPEKSRQGLLSQLTSNVISGLLKTGVGAILCFGIIAEEFFRLAFGPQWIKSGQIILWMLPWFIFQFVSSPISMVMHVTGKQRGIMILTMLGFVLRSGAVIAAAKLQERSVVFAYAASGAVFYLLCFWVFTKAADISGKQLMKLFLKNIPYLAAWVAFGVALRFALQEFK